jgi:hypothetical protein
MELHVQEDSPSNRQHPVASFQAASVTNPPSLADCPPYSVGPFLRFESSWNPRYI